jgi:Na+-driven multidrug efflux pump
VTMICIGGLLFVLRGHVAALFTDDQAVIEMYSGAIIALAISQV